MKPITLSNVLNNPLSNHPLNSTLNSSLNNTLSTSQQHLVQQYQQQMDNLLNGQQQQQTAVGNPYLTQLYNSHSMFNNSLLSMLPNMYPKDGLFNPSLQTVEPKIDLPISFEHLFSNSNEIRMDLENVLKNRSNMEDRHSDNESKCDHGIQNKHLVDDHLIEQKRTDDQLDKSSDGDQYLSSIIGQLNGKHSNKSRKRPLDCEEMDGELTSSECSNETIEKTNSKHLDQNVIKHSNTKRTKTN